MRIFVFLLALSLSLQAIDNFQAMHQVKEWLREFLPKDTQTTNYYVLYPETEMSQENKVSFKFANQNYIFLYAIAKHFTHNKLDKNA
ncbi:hypothetical protein [Helicobacter suis]|uniref:hypothetical protein n=1 Tax=Helicobacter suis TaxID=104628 RepID=UPI0002E69918|nr:hypothetical protein [Helicobacter suis]BCD51313.1 hypothetical protein NHP194022_09840 [Helicobacter suis]